MKYILITNDPEVASISHPCGIDRLMVDLELLNKNERQGKLDTFITTHSPADIAVVRAAAPDCELIVRLNPLNENSANEINHAIKAGTDFIMQPYFRSSEEVRKFSSLIGGRCGFMPLVEHIQALENIDAILAVDGITETYLGLNDLNISRSGKFMFKAFTDGLVDRFAEAAKSREICFGIGGIGAIGNSKLPAEIILPEHKRVGSSRVILGRAFQDAVTGGDKLTDHEDQLKIEIGKLNEVLEQDYSDIDYSTNRQQMKKIIDEVEALMGSSG